MANVKQLLRNTKCESKHFVEQKSKVHVKAEESCFSSCTPNVAAHMIEDSLSH